MKTSHHTDGPGSILRPGPGDLAAFYANDNQPRPPAPDIDACGLVLSAEASKNGAHFAMLRILAQDGSLSEPIDVVCEPWDIIAHWRSLGRELDLPLYLRDTSGAMTPVAPLAGEHVFAHHGGSPLSGRRPRFLARRQVPLTRLHVVGGTSKTGRKL